MKLRKIPLAYIILFLVAISVGISIDAGDSESHILKYGALYELKTSNVPMRIKILREVTRTGSSQKIAVFKASSAFFSIDEKSRFILDRGEIMPLEYSYTRRALGKTDSETFAFDQDNDLGKSTGVREGNKENVFDKLSVQYQLQLDIIREKEIEIGESFSYQVREKGKLKRYKFIIAGTEKIDTELGSLRTIRITRDRKRDNRATILWLAPDYEYTLVKMIQREGDRVWNLEIKDWLKKRE